METILILGLACLLLLTLIAWVRQRHQAQKFDEAQNLIMQALISMLKDRNVAPEEMAKYYLEYIEVILETRKYEDYIKGICDVNDVAYRTDDGKVSSDTVNRLVKALADDTWGTYNTIDHLKERRRKSRLLE